MAFPQVASRTNTAFPTANTTHAASYPATINSGDLLLLLCGFKADPTITTPSGFTAVAGGQASGSAAGNKSGLYGRVADGTEGGGTVSITINQSRRGSAQIIRVTGWYGTLAGVEAAFVNTSGTTNPNPPSLSPSWGGAQNLFIAGICTSDDDEYPTAAPTNYTDISYIQAGGGADVSVTTATALRELEAASDDPGTFTLNESGNSGAYTIAVRPSSGSSVSVTPTTGSIAITGQAPTAAVTANIYTAPGAGSLAITGYAPTAAATAGVYVYPGQGTITLSGSAPTVAVTAGIYASPDAGSLALTGFEPTVTVTAGVFVYPSAASIGLTGYAPDVEALSGVNPSPGAGAITLTGYTPSVLAVDPKEAQPGSGAISLTGYAPTALAVNPVAVTPDAGTLTLAGYVPTVAALAPILATPGHGAIVLSSYAPTVTAIAPASAAPNYGSLVLTGYAPTVATLAYVVSADRIITVPASDRTIAAIGVSRTYTVPARSRTITVN